MAKKTQTFIHRTRQRIPTQLFQSSYRKSVGFIQSRPFSSFFIALALLFIVILLGNILTRPQVQPAISQSPKPVSVYTIGEAPQATFQAKIDKSGVIKIVALAPGIVQSIFVTEGDSVSQGQQLFSLSTNYQGGNAPAIQSQIADTQYKNVLDTFDEQNSIIQKERDIANINHDNFGDMQNIATASASDTSSLINANQAVLNALNQQLSQDQSNGASPSALIPEEEQINQLQGAQNQLNISLRNLHQQTNSDNTQGRLADAQRDLALQQLDIQQKSLELNKEISKLQADVADVEAATMFPASPFAGVVQRVYVRIGQQVNPGTVLAEISGSKSQISAIVDVPQEIVTKMSLMDTGTLYIGGTTYSVRPTFIPTEATNNQLYSIVYPLTSIPTSSVSDGEYVRIDIPVGQPNTSAAVPFVPLDAIYQTSDSSYLFLMKNNKAVAQPVHIGDVFGSFAEITEGLTSGDQVITDRTVVNGDKVVKN